MSYIPFGFALKTPAHQHFSFDSVACSTAECMVGTLHGEKRSLLALVNENATELSQWQIVHLKGVDTQGNAMFDSVAVFGSLSEREAVSYAVRLGAKQLAMYDAVQVGDVLSSNEKGLIRHLDKTYFDFKQPIPAWHLAKMQDVLTDEKVLWDGIELKSHKGDVGALLHDMIRHDDHKALLDSSMSLADWLEHESVEQMQFDAVYMEYRKLENFADKLHLAMQDATKASNKVEIESCEISKPFKRQGMAQIAVLYTFNDGQTVTAFFNNPDSTPAQMNASDIIVAWKWAMNGRDVTGVIQGDVHERNPNAKMIKDLAVRIVKLVSQNSSRFKRTQAKKLERQENINATLQRIEQKTALKDTLMAENERLQAELDAKASREQVDEPIELTGKEFTHYNLDFELESNKQILRDEVRSYLDNIAKNTKTIFNKFLGRDIVFSERGINEMMAWSHQVIKMQALHSIVNIIKNSVADGSDFIQPNKKKDKKSHALNYYRMKADIKIGGIPFTVRVIFEEDQNGILHYDVIMPKTAYGKNKAIFDSLPHDTHPWNESNTAYASDNTLTDNISQDGYDDNLFDSANQNYVLNLFIFDKDGNEIKDEPSDDSANNQEAKKLSKAEKQAIYELTSATDTYYSDNGGYHLRDTDIIDKYGNKRGEIDFYFDITAKNYIIGYVHDTDYYRDKDEYVLDKSIGLDEFKKQVLQTYKDFKELLQETPIPYAKPELDKRITGVTLDWNGWLGFDKSEHFKDLDGLNNRLKEQYQDESNIPEYGYDENDITIHYTDTQGRTGTLAWRFDISHKDFNPFTQDIKQYLGEQLAEEGIDVTPINPTTDDKPTQNIELTGKEFGEFDLTSDDGKKAMREKAIEMLNTLKSTSVFCPVLNANVSFDTAGIKKIKSFSANPIKLQALYAIKDLIKQATIVEKDKPSYDVKESERGITYSVLKTPFKINDIEYGARLVVRKIDDKNYQYDLQIKSNVSEIFDSVEIENDERVSANKSDFFHRWLDNMLFDGESQSLFDDANITTKAGYVLNLFIFDKDGNEIKDEPSHGSTSNQKVSNSTVVKLKDAREFLLNNVLKGDASNAIFWADNEQYPEQYAYFKVMKLTKSNFSKFSNQAKSIGHSYANVEKLPHENSGGTKEGGLRESAKILEKLGYEVDKSDKSNGVVYPKNPLPNVGSFYRIQQSENYFYIAEYVGIANENQGAKVAELAFVDVVSKYKARMNANFYDELYIQGNITEVTEQEVQDYIQWATRKEHSVYVNSKGNTVASVFTERDSFVVDYGSGSGRNFEDKEKVQSYLQSIKEDLPSLKFAYGDENLLDMTTGKTKEQVEQEKAKQDYGLLQDYKPRTPTLKQLLTGRTLVTNKDRTIWSNGHLMDLGGALTIDAEPTMVKDDDVLNRLLDGRLGEVFTHYALHDKSIILTTNDHNNMVMLNPLYVAHFQKRYPNALFVASPDTSKVVFVVLNGEKIGVIVKLVTDLNLKDILDEKRLQVKDLQPKMVENTVANQRQSDFEQMQETAKELGYEVESSDFTSSNLLYYSRSNEEDDGVRISIMAKYAKDGSRSDDFEIYINGEFEESFENYEDALVKMNQLVQQDKINKPTQQGETMNEYEQYLQDIIDGNIDLELVDMDKMIEIGENGFDGNDLYEQALDVISRYEDEMTKDI